MNIDRFLGRREGVLVMNGSLQPVELITVEECPDQNPTLTMIALEGYRARSLSEEFRHTMRRSYGMMWNDSGNKTPDIEKVIFHDPATIVIWKDKTKTVVKCQEGDTYSPELGLAMCIAKKYLGNKGNFNEVFKKWIPEEKVKETLVATDTEGNVIKCFEKDLGPEPEEIEKMRNDLMYHCSYVGGCEHCSLENEDTSCEFVSKTDAGNYVVSDEDIRKYHKMIFGNKED